MDWSNGTASRGFSKRGWGVPRGRGGGERGGYRGSRGGGYEDRGGRMSFKGGRGGGYNEENHSYRGGRSSRPRSSGFSGRNISVRIGNSGNRGGLGSGGGVGSSGGRSVYRQVGYGEDNNSSSGYRSEQQQYYSDYTSNYRGQDGGYDESPIGFRGGGGGGGGGGRAPRRSRGGGGYGGSSYSPRGRGGYEGGKGGFEGSGDMYEGRGMGRRGRGGSSWGESNGYEEGRPRYVETIDYNNYDSGYNDYGGGYDGGSMSSQYDDSNRGYQTSRGMPVDSNRRGMRGSMRGSRPSMRDGRSRGRVSRGIASRIGGIKEIRGGFSGIRGGSYERRGRGAIRGMGEVSRSRGRRILGVNRPSVRTRGVFSRLSVTTARGRAPFRRVITNYRGSFRGVRGRGRIQYPDSRVLPKKKIPEKDPCAVYLGFPEAITADMAKELLEFAKDATKIHFGKRCYAVFSSEEEAQSMETQLSEMEFEGLKPTFDTPVRGGVAPEKRQGGEDSDASPPKKSKVEDENVEQELEDSKELVELDNDDEDEDDDVAVIGEEKEEEDEEEEEVDEAGEGNEDLVEDEEAAAAYEDEEMEDDDGNEVECLINEKYEMVDLSSTDAVADEN